LTGSRKASTAPLSDIGGGQLDAGWLWLAAEVSGATLFAGPGFQRALRAAFAQGSEARIALAGRPDRPDALVPFEVVPRRAGPFAWREARFFRNRHTLRNHLLLRHPGAARELLEGILDAEGWDVLFLENIPPDVSSLVAAAAELGLGSDSPAEGRSLLHADTRDGREAYLATRSGELRRQLRKRTREMEKAGRLETTRLRGPEVVAGLPAFWALEDRAWQGTILAPEDRAADRAFDAALAALPDPGELWLLRFDGALVAALRLLGDGRAAYLHKMLYEPGLARLAPGVVLFGAMMQAVAEDPRQRIDFNGTSPFFARWATGETRHVTLRLYRASWRGHALHRSRTPREWLRGLRAAGSTRSAPAEER
jgi:CelD/BcsL family acetyltransferase involved in cellulose biosynthesis